MVGIFSRLLITVFVAITVALIIGYINPITEYFYDGKEVYPSHPYVVKKEVFNYKLGLISGSITASALIVLFFLPALLKRKTE
ncbi:MAG TPA: hypothetical protein VK498_10955 [Ferruginibacter sp.]|nr:hypothetical protein [Ferruginibacter sp.]